MDHDEARGPGAPPAADLTRRRVLGAGLLALGGLGIAGFSVAVGRYLSPLQAGGAAADAELALDALAVWDSQRLLVRGRPCFVVRTPDQILAVSAVCTHLGCIVRWQRGRRIFFCPCHGARFAPDGRVLGGPAPNPLAPFQVAVGDGKIVVRPA